MRKPISSRHVLAEPAERRADQEEHDRDLQDELAAVEVAELAVERAGDRRGQQVRGDDPREVGDPAEVADDRRQRRRDDRLVERGEQQHEHQRQEDQAQARLRLDRCSVICGIIAYITQLLRTAIIWT